MAFCVVFVEGREVVMPFCDVFVEGREVVTSFWQQEVQGGNWQGVCQPKSRLSGRLSMLSGRLTRTRWQSVVLLAEKSVFPTTVVEFRPSGN